jgi:putative ABC transport system permease protein
VGAISSQSPGNTLAIATVVDPEAALPLIERLLRDFDPDLAIYNVLPYRDIVRGALYSQRMNAELFSVVALLGLALAAAGIFSVMNLAVTRRTREIGIRMAIGAHRTDIARLVIGKALTPVALGLAGGLLATLAMTRLVRSLLHGVQATDPLSFTTATGVLVAAALLAAYLPARRAAAVDPLTSLRSE